MFLPSCSGTNLLKEFEMQPAILPAVVLAMALAAASWAAPAFLATASAADGPARAVAAPLSGSAPPTGAMDWGGRAAAAAADARALIAAGYAQAPALMLVLPALLVLPAVALVSFIVQVRARRKAERAASRALELKAGMAADAEEPPPAEAAPLWPHQAWLSVADGARTLPLAGQLIRIGRHHDNDIRLPDTLVHRYHAVIEHTAEEAFVITDLSGKDGNGVRINGERLARAQLADGDIIELGRTRLKFESVPV